MNADLIQLLAISLAATIALCMLVPRWDTGGGVLLIFSLGIPALPVIGAVVITILTVYLAWLLLYFIVIAPVVWVWKRMH